MPAFAVFTRLLCAVLLATAGAVSALAADAPPDAPNPALSQAIGLAIGADIPAALEVLRKMPVEGLSAKRAALRQCMLDRFATDTPSADGLDKLPPAEAAIALAYRRYWHALLLKRKTEGEAVSRLVQDVDARLPPTAKGPAAGAKVEDREPAIGRLFDHDHLHVLTGLTRPLHELMVWRRQTTRREHVELPAGSIDVKVLLLDDFVNFGWTGYATCDRIHTGGWAEKDGLHVVLPSTPLGSDAYKASLLTHESQHYADYRAYPHLDQPDLEYRAKLAELWASRDSTRDLLDGFAGSMKRDRALPHPFADFWVVTRLRERLGLQDLASADLARVRAVAVDLLREHSRELDRKGPAHVTTALPD
jgi:hypothetical protein